MNKTRDITVTVNGTSHEAAVEPRLLLADFLRHTLGLTGTHVGCEHGVCGACTVLVDGDSARSCLMFAVQADGCSIETVESLGRIGQLNALQESFHEHHALQCGFCTPGMLMTATDLLRKYPLATDDDIRQGLSGNLCRCTGYEHIVKAIRAVVGKAGAADENASSLRRPAAHAQNHLSARRRAQRDHRNAGVAARCCATAPGNVLFDTGCHPAVPDEAEARWGGLAKLMTPIMQPGDNVVNALGGIGLQCDDIDVVVCSHLHPDHCGCNSFFKRATFIIHAEEVAAARAPGAAASGYLAAEWEQSAPTDMIDGERDLFGDGRIVLIPLPGHTPGTTGALVALERSGTFLLASDTVSLRSTLDTGVIPKNTWNADALCANRWPRSGASRRAAPPCCAVMTMRNGRACGKVDAYDAYD